ncbi:hypothetical protein NAC44_11190 [Allorhizobium sp. BGMRC 0089]|uniref:hypothetical protein n=1 Tax=Allorhizobium sonneratiae TaxID=2934936 RepID=UPI00203376F4|nr:hypothetical protein [Allorhizobium sonneratiae]MCM2292888.1 hypothetical protein [Allorhizobium sonneratiae]
MFDHSFPIHPSCGKLSRYDIAAHPLFVSVQRCLSGYFIDLHTKSPRLSRLQSSLRKTLMTQALYSLALQRQHTEPLSGLTAARYAEIMSRTGTASRNTATSYLAELVAYKLLQEADGVTDRRLRVLILTDVSRTAMVNWFLGHLHFLDKLDRGHRCRQFQGCDALFVHSQSALTKLLFEDPLWNKPPDSINSFLSSDMGIMILHDLFHRLPQRLINDRYTLGPVSLGMLSSKYLVSTTTLKRIFKISENEGLLGWEQSRRRGDLWLSPQFVKSTIEWQAAKLELINTAFVASCNQLGINRNAIADTGDAKHMFASSVQSSAKDMTAPFAKYGAQNSL